MSLEHIDGQTVLVGVVTDQAHLQGLLERIARMGLQLVSVAPERTTDASREAAQ
jgi:hypothetical protein